MDGTRSYRVRSRRGQRSPPEADASGLGDGRLYRHLADGYAILYGHSLHIYWETVGKYLVILAMGELLWIVLWWGFVYASWQSAREIRRERADLE